MHPRNWYKQDKTKGRGSKLEKPYSNIVVGSDPLDGMTTKDASKFHAIINVSCSPCALFYPAYKGQAMYWIPVNEMGVWNYSAFVQIVKIMQFHYKKKHKIYVHCHAGAYRSPTMTMIWLRATQRVAYKLGKHNLRVQMSWEEAYRISHGISKERFEERLKEDGIWGLKYFRGNMPPNFNAFMARLEHNLDKPYSYVDCLDGEAGRLSKDREVRAKVQGWRTSQKILRPFRKIKWLYGDFKRYLKDLSQGYVTVRLSRGFSTTIEGDDLLRQLILKWRKR